MHAPPPAPRTSTLRYSSLPARASASRRCTALHFEVGCPCLGRHRLPRRRRSGLWLFRRVCQSSGGQPASPTRAAAGQASRAEPAGAGPEHARSDWLFSAWRSARFELQPGRHADRVGQGLPLFTRTGLAAAGKRPRAYSRGWHAMLAGSSGWLRPLKLQARRERRPTRCRRLHRCQSNDV